MASQIQRVASRTRAVRIDKKLEEMIAGACLDTCEMVLDHVRVGDLRRVYNLVLGWPVAGARKQWFVEELAHYYHRRPANTLSR